MRFTVPLLLVLGTACDGLTSFNIDGSTTTEVPAGTLLEALVGDVGFSDLLNMDITENTEMQNQGVGPEDIREVRLTSFRLVVVEPNGADLSFLQSMTLSVEAPDVAKVRVASADSFPEGVGTVDFDLDDVDLAPYAVSQSMTLTTDVNGRRPDEDTTIRAEYEMSIKATLKGVTSAASGD